VSSFDGKPDSEEEERLSANMARAVSNVSTAMHEASAAGDEVGAWFFAGVRNDLMQAWQRGLRMVTRINSPKENSKQ
jgi:hypothetical protein